MIFYIKVHIFGKKKNIIFLRNNICLFLILISYYLYFIVYSIHNLINNLLQF